MRPDVYASNLAPRVLQLEKECARLKAINKELLEAMERTLDWLTSYPGGGGLGDMGPYNQARAALAKAKENPNA